MMYQVKKIVGRGLPITNERASAVFAIGGRYVVREICATGRKVSGLEDRYFGFLSSRRYSEESLEETAVRAAKQWGFDVEARRPLISEQSGALTFHHILCRNVYPEKNEAQRIYFDPEDNEERILLLLTPEEVAEHKLIRENTKQIIEKLELGQI